MMDAIVDALAESGQHRDVEVDKDRQLKELQRMVSALEADKQAIYQLLVKNLLSIDVDQFAQNEQTRIQIAKMQDAVRMLSYQKFELLNDITKELDKITLEVVKHINEQPSTYMPGSKTIDVYVGKKLSLEKVNEWRRRLRKARQDFDKTSYAGQLKSMYAADKQQRINIINEIFDGVSNRKLTQQQFEELVKSRLDAISLGILNRFGGKREALEKRFLELREQYSSESKYAQDELARSKAVFMQVFEEHADKHYDKLMELTTEKDNKRRQEIISRFDDVDKVLDDLAKAKSKVELPILKEQLDKLSEMVGKYKMSMATQVFRFLLYPVEWTILRPFEFKVGGSRQHFERDKAKLEELRDELQELQSTSVQERDSEYAERLAKLVTDIKSFEAEARRWVSSKDIKAVDEIREEIEAQDLEESDEHVSVKRNF